MLIVHILNSLCIGGIEKAVTEIAANQRLLGHKVVIITLSNIDFTLKANLNQNIQVIALPFKNDSIKSIISFWLLGIPQAIKIIIKMKPDIVHSHLYFHYFLFISLVLRLCAVKPKHFRTVHTSGLFYSSKSLLNRFRSQIEKIALRIYPTYLISISKIIFNNNDRLFSKVAVGNRLIPNGINLTTFSKLNYTHIKKNDFGLQDDCMIVSYVSRLDNGKNHVCLLNAWKEVLKFFPDSHLCLAGDGVLKRELMDYVKLLDIDHKVSFLGTINNVSSLLSITDIAVFPSQFEGFPLSLIEEMAMGLPVITSDIDIFKEVIVNNENGIICNVNDPNDYADKLIKLMREKDLRNKIGNEAKETAKKFDIKRIVNETLHFYEEALSI